MTVKIYLEEITSAKFDEFDDGYDDVFQQYENLIFVCCEETLTSGSVEAEDLIVRLNDYGNVYDSVTVDVDCEGRYASLVIKCSRRATEKEVFLYNFLEQENVEAMKLCSDLTDFFTKRGNKD